MAKIDALDAYFADHPYVREDGTVPQAATLYPTLVNTSARVLNQLAAHIETTRPTKTPLDHYLEADAVEDGDGD
jgi:hypothetical protein